MEWSKLGLSITLGTAAGIISAGLDKTCKENRHRSNSVLDKLKALDRKIYLDGKSQADQFENIKQSFDKK